jgi:hypothetical protein
MDFRQTKMRPLSKLSTNNGRVGAAGFGTVLTVALAISIAACTTVPVDQIKYFSQAFNTVNTVGQPLLDDLAVAERKQGQQIAERRARGESTQGANNCPRSDYPWQEAAGNLGIIRGFCPKQPVVAAFEVARVDAYRTTVANYVVLLGKMQSAWDLTVTAAVGRPSHASVASLVQQTSELKGDAEAARRAFAILRTGGVAVPTN